MRIKVTKQEGRLDAYIVSKVEGYSRSFLSSLISQGKVLVNGAPSKASYKPSVGDVIEISIPEPVIDETTPQDIPLDIVYEDSDLLIINKPQGMVVHPACGHHEDTLVNALLSHCEGNLSDINGVIRPGIVHRIDKDTSGLMVAVKNNETHLKMADMLSKHEIRRQYRALVYGIVQPNKGTIDAPIGRSSSDRRKMCVTDDGKPSITHFEVINRYTEATDMRLLLETGRTHQIRVHMSYIGHQVVGDPVYASKRKSFGLVGQALHSESISFNQPNTGKLLEFTTSVPQYYSDLLSSFSRIEI